MSNYPPEFCPYCGHALHPVTPPTAFYCPDCEDHVFHNPTPSARTLVLDTAADARGEDRFLLVQQGTGPVGKWLTPGGKVEIGNTPAEHAALELREETNLRVDSDDLVLFESGTAEVPSGHHIVDVYFTVERSRTTGTLEAGDDARVARYVTMDEFAATDQHGYEEQVEHVRTIRETARTRLDQVR